MGCLFELIFGAAFEIIGEIICNLYTKLIAHFVPEHQFNPKLRKRIKKGLYIFTEVMFCSALFGLYILFDFGDSSVAATVGACMFFIPVGITGMIILVGIIDRIVHYKRKRR